MRIRSVPAGIRELLYLVTLDLPLENVGKEPGGCLSWVQERGKVCALDSALRHKYFLVIAAEFFEKFGLREIPVVDI